MQCLLVKVPTSLTKLFCLDAIPIKGMWKKKILSMEICWTHLVWESSNKKKKVQPANAVMKRDQEWMKREIRKRNGAHVMPVYFFFFEESQSIFWYLATLAYILNLTSNLEGLSIYYFIIKLINLNIYTFSQ